MSVTVLRGRVFPQLDLDILDPTILPGSVPAPGGLDVDELAAVLADLAASATIVGLERTAFDPPEHGELVEPPADAIAPVLPG